MPKPAGSVKEKLSQRVGFLPVGDRVSLTIHPDRDKILNFYENFVCIKSSKNMRIQTIAFKFGGFENINAFKQNIPPNKYDSERAYELSLQE